ncbi:hypothetical protein RHMOL_Rhmol01G0232200 [Rhododendron molle]|uniref:Uncharacterized protein n=1 Tax=Rhododendron molle TaxID=49168 RepID=A0ACC0Q606_RHOML|nr:hypothetical protein RHMOL_Rhmol01G0232200 [Rhododendron molle]
MGGVVGHVFDMVNTAFISSNVYNGPPTLIYCSPLLHSSFTLPVLPFSTEKYRIIAVASNLLLLSLCEELSRDGPPTYLDSSLSFSLSLLCRFKSPSSLSAKNCRETAPPTYLDSSLSLSLSLSLSPGYNFSLRICQPCPQSLCESHLQISLSLSPNLSALFPFHLSLR